MSSFRGNIEHLTVRNNYYRKVLFTVPKSMQLVVMSLRPKEEIGSEVHPRISQFIRVESGKGVAKIGRKKYRLSDGVALVVPKGTRHNIINTSSSKPLKLYSIYSPPEHAPDTKEYTKDEE
jgi:mannose-6-phosphate isomerase-like protein (cupin superfamily)